jgi:hypothetical protein
MIIRTLLVASALYFLFFPKKSTWSIVEFVLNKAAIQFNYNRYCYTFNADFTSKVEINNPNLLGSLVYKSRYELFVVFSQYNIQRIGFTDVDPGLIPGKGSQIVSSIGKIEDLNIVLSLKILHELWKNDGVLSVMALGIAEVKPQIHGNIQLIKAVPTFLVGIKCMEKVKLSFARNYISLAANISQNCNYTYELKLYDDEGDKILKLDRKYLYNPI